MAEHRACSLLDVCVEGEGLGRFREFDEENVGVDAYLVEARVQILVRHDEGLRPSLFPSSLSLSNDLVPCLARGAHSSYAVRMGTLHDDSQAPRACMHRDCDLARAAGVLDELRDNHWDPDSQRVVEPRVYSRWGVVHDDSHREVEPHVCNHDIHLEEEVLFCNQVEVAGPPLSYIQKVEAPSYSRGVEVPCDNLQGEEGEHVLSYSRQVVVCNHPTRVYSLQVERDNHPEWMEGVIWN